MQQKSHSLFRVGSGGYMSIEPRVLALFISVDNEKKRVHKEKLELDENGVLEDKFYAKNKDI